MMLWVKFTRLPHTLRILEAQLRHHIKAPPWQTSGPRASVAISAYIPVVATILWRFLALPDTHTCANTSCCYVLLCIICSLSGFRFGYVYTIVSLQNYRTKLIKPPEYPLDIPRYAMNSHDRLTDVAILARLSSEISVGRVCVTPKSRRIPRI